MADSKRTECVKVCFTEREFLDLGWLCAHENRSPAEMVWVMARRYMYGSVEQKDRRREGTNADQ